MRAARRGGVLAVCWLFALTACGAGDPAPPQAGAASSAAAEPTAASPSPSDLPPPPSCAEQTLADLSLDQQAGQLLMIGVPATDPVAGFAQLSGVPVGAVFLHGRNFAGADAVRAAVAQLQAETALPLQVAVDQEGGLVQTLKGPGFELLPTALEQGQQDPAVLRTTVAGWAAKLRAAGITMDLAPVADTVPADREATNPPIGAFDREYGSDPTRVAAAVSAVVTGLQEGGVTSTVKHFPGLGRVRLNTDTDRGATDPQSGPDDPYLRPFAAAVTAGTGAVMVSSASYPQLDADRLGVFSPTVIGLLRGQLGFTGVVVSDDLGAAVAVSDVPVGDRAVDAVAAGVDVVLTVQTADAAPMAQALIARAMADPAFAARVTESAGRVLALKERFGLLHC